MLRGQRNPFHAKALRRLGFFTLSIKPSPPSSLGISIACALASAQTAAFKFKRYFPVKIAYYCSVFVRLYQIAESFVPVWYDTQQKARCPTNFNAH